MRDEVEVALPRLVLHPVHPFLSRVRAGLGALLAATASAQPAHADAETAACWPVWDTWFALALVLGAVIYGRGALRLRRSPAGRIAFHTWQLAAFTGGWLALAVALASPLDQLSDALLSAHVARHQLLTLVAAPLLVLARPGLPLLWSLRWHRRERLGARLRRSRVHRAGRAVAEPAVVFVLHGVAMWAWYAPALFAAAVRHEAVHAGQHGALFWTAVLLWSSFVHERARRGAAGLAVLLTAVHSGVLGALMSRASKAWYTAYGGRTDAFALTALDDQRLAGLVLCACAGAMLVVVSLTVFASRLGEAKRTAGPARTAALGEPPRNAGDGW